MIRRREKTSKQIENQVDVKSTLGSLLFIRHIVQHSYTLSVQCTYLYR